jgi:hypothetical protein
MKAHGPPHFRGANAGIIVRVSDQCFDGYRSIRAARGLRAGKTAGCRWFRNCGTRTDGEMNHVTCQTSTVRTTPQTQMLAPNCTGRLELECGSTRVDCCGPLPSGCAHAKRRADVARATFCLNPLNPSGQLAARRLILLSASVVSFLSVALSSSRVFCRMLAQSLRPSCFAQAIRLP